jgi:hypothetical protein
LTPCAKRSGFCSTVRLPIIATPVAEHLLRYAADAGYQAILVEPDAELAAKFNGAGVEVHAGIGSLAGSMTDVVVTDHHRGELGIMLRDALASPARWVGIMGNPRHEAPHLQALALLGVARSVSTSAREPRPRSRSPPSPASSPTATAGRAASALAEPSGYSGTPLPRKLGIGEDDEVVVVGATDSFTDSLAALLGDSAVLYTDLGDAALFDVIIALFTRRAELEDQLDRLRSKMAPACGLWIAWPKRASKVPTDLTDNVIREVALPTGLVDNKVCAIDQTWSALRLVIRRELRPR